MRIAGFDHVSLPLQNTDAMVAFYRAPPDALHERLAGVGVTIEEGPVARQGGRRADATSVSTDATPTETSSSS